MTWAALRLSPRLPLINRPPLPCESPALAGRNSRQGGCGPSSRPDRAYARHPVQQVRLRHFAADRRPAGARTGVHGPSMGRSRSPRNRFPGRPGLTPPPGHDQHALPGHDSPAPVRAGRQPPWPPRARRSGESFFTGVSTVEMRHGARRRADPLSWPACVPRPPARSAAGPVPPPSAARPLAGPDRPWPAWRWPGLAAWPWPGAVGPGQAALRRLRLPHRPGAPRRPGPWPRRRRAWPPLPPPPAPGSPPASPASCGSGSPRCSITWPDGTARSGSCSTTG